MDSSKYIYEEFEDKIKEIDSSKINIREGLLDAEELRRKFVTTYSIDRIKTMVIEDYVIGLKPTNDESNFNFCFILEYRLIDLGNIKGRESGRYGVYYDKDEKKYLYTKKFGGELNAFQEIKELIIDVIIKGDKKDLKGLIDNNISPVLKGKILSTYYPNRFLNIFSEKHLKHFLKNIYIDCNSKGIDLIVLREKLVDYKKNHPIMKDWEMVVFTKFLYKTFTLNGKITSEAVKNNNDIFPITTLTQKPEFIDYNIGEKNLESNEDKIEPLSYKNPDYNKQARIQKRIGNLAESIVLNLELERTKKFTGYSKEVTKVILDSYGYDILSFEEDGEERFIEVKAVKNRENNVNFFLTANEYEKSKSIPNYWIYMVFGVLTESPKVWPIRGSSFVIYENVNLSPILYRVGFSLAR